MQRLKQEAAERGERAVAAAQSILVRAAPDDVYRRALSPQDDAVAARGEVVDPDERPTGHLRELLELPPDDVAGLATEDHDARLAGRGEQRLAQRVVERPRPRGAGQRSSDEAPRRDRERHERRRAHVVLEHDELAAAVADDVEPRDRDPSLLALGQIGDVRLEPRAVVEQVVRHDAGAERLARSERVAHERLERADALLEPGGERRPLLFREDARDRIDRELVRPVARAVDDAPVPTSISAYWYCVRATHGRHPSALLASSAASKRSSASSMRPQTFRRYALQAGFRDLQILDIDLPMQRYYRLVP